jgi:flagellar hook-length control protein FliK
VTKDKSRSWHVNEPVIQDEGTTMSNNAAKSGKSDKASNLMTVTGQAITQTTEPATASGGKTKFSFKETVNSTDKDSTIKTTFNQPEIDTTKPAVAERTIKPANKSHDKSSGNEGAINIAGKKADKEVKTQNPAGELIQQTSLNNVQGNIQRTKTDKTIMSKSQIDSIVKHLTGQINSGTSSLEVDLQPEALGKIKLMLQMDDGSLTVRIIAHTEEAHGLLDASLQNIKDGLNQQGIKVDNLSLDLAGQERHGNQSGNSYSESGRSAKSFSEKKENYDNTVIGEYNPQQHNRLNILA